ncbi:MAG: C_GCAxxG_C_C family protein [Clostridia bacterium]|nr:C_GCAxxG_C_C family protein [Clostridia bacterium]
MKMSRGERAKEYFLQGYACSQAVALAFSDLLGVSEEEIIKLTLPFGGGMGRLRLTCGAVSGMAFVIGGVVAKGKNDKENKKKVYETVQTLCKKFQEETGSLICAELLSGTNATSLGEAEPRTAEYYKKRPCAELVFLAASILEEYFK